MSEIKDTNYTESEKELMRQEYFINRVKELNDEHFERTGKKMMYHIVTWGCQANEHDSEKISGILESLGYIPANSREEADIILFNTCLIRENAELKVYGNLGELKSLKRKNPDLIIGICGCMMQKEEVRNLIKEKYRFVDLIFGTHNLHKLPELISNNIQSTKMIVDVWENGEEVVEGVPAKRKYDYKALINITYGCNNFCTYCIVPYTRGRERSRDPEDILEEIKKLVKNDCKEITLLGQNVNSYGKTLKEKVSFADLLRMVDKIDGIERIRFMTSHPKDLSDELIYAIRDCDKVCNHVHLPFQAGSNNTLKAMNRKYTKEQYLSLVKKLKQEVPDISLTTDIIVGFPGETEEDFEDTLDLVREVGFDSAYTFLYSVREGTPAATMENQVPDDVKHNRFKRLLDTLNPIIYENNLKFKDTVQKILVEDTNKSEESMLSGRTETSKLVHFEGSKDLIGKIVSIKIDTVKTWSLEGHLIEDEQ